MDGTLYKFSYKDGAEPDPYSWMDNDFWEDDCHYYDSLVPALEQICNRIGVDYTPNAIVGVDGLNDDSPRIRIGLSFLTDEDGIEATQREKDAWEKGELQLYLLDINVWIEKARTRKPDHAELDKELGVDSAVYY